MPAAGQLKSRPVLLHRGTAPLLHPGKWRAGLSLLLNLAGFVAVNAFWWHLSTGRWADFDLQTFRGDLAVPLGRVLLEPLNIFTHPWMVLVTGLLLAMIIFVPILVAVLYRLVFAIVFVLVVAVLGHAPLLAATLAIGCLLAARTPLRGDMPFLAILLGMVPVTVYIYVFALPVVFSSAVQPLQRGVAGAPFLIALLGAVLSGALVLALARLVAYRPGVVWPVLTLLLAGVTVIFHTRVGTDELRYSIITARMAPGDAVFKPLALEAWKQDNRQKGLTAEGFRNAVTDKLQTRRGKLVRDCEAFVARYGTGRRAAAVLWVAGQCHSLRVDYRALADGLIRYYASHPSLAARNTWARLSEQYPASPQAALAHWRLGQLAMRELAAESLPDWRISERLDRAATRLRWAEERLSVIVADFDSRNRREFIDRVFLPTGPLPTEGYYRQALFTVQCLRWLIEANEVAETWEAASQGDDRQAKADARKLVCALGRYVDLDPNRPDYRRQLSELAGEFEATKLGDNLKLAFAGAVANPYERAGALIVLAEVRPPTDAAIQANYELGILATGTADGRVVALIQNLKKPREYFELVVAAPDNPWRPLAREHLNWLETEEP
ncbi:MAG: hypothetical protein QF577_05660 [Phycisphaerae bacterium]|jgi:hypothetical protein|nr:hypothetical protein [Phycisphaerae bacterium]MDP7637017.1 hypothetical protein [Phycisphaerae bacterium]